MNETLGDQLRGFANKFKPQKSPEPPPSSSPPDRFTPTGPHFASHPMAPIRAGITDFSQEPPAPRFTSLLIEGAKKRRIDFDQHVPNPDNLDISPLINNIDGQVEVTESDLPKLMEALLPGIYWGENQIEAQYPSTAGGVAPLYGPGAQATIETVDGRPIIKITNADIFLPLDAESDMPLISGQLDASRRNKILQYARENFIGDYSQPPQFTRTMKGQIKINELHLASEEVPTPSSTPKHRLKILTGGTNLEIIDLNKEQRSIETEEFRRYLEQMPHDQLTHTLSARITEARVAGGLDTDPQLGQDIGISIDIKDDAAGRKVILSVHPKSQEEANVAPKASKLPDPLKEKVISAPEAGHFMKAPELVEFFQGVYPDVSWAADENSPGAKLGIQIVQGVPALVLENLEINLSGISPEEKKQHALYRLKLPFGLNVPVMEVSDRLAQPGIKTTIKRICLRNPSRPQNGSIALPDSLQVMPNSLEIEVIDRDKIRNPQAESILTKAIQKLTHIDILHGLKGEIEEARRNHNPSELSEKTNVGMIISVNPKYPEEGEIYFSVRPNTKKR